MRLRPCTFTSRMQPSLLQSALRTSAALLCAGAVALLPVGSALAAECAEKQGLFSDDRLVTLLIVTETIALLGAGVGGTLARQRKEELERMNAQLRQINLSLRKQARTEVYAPSLTYAPPQRAEPVAVAPAAAAAAAPAADAAPPVVNTRAKAMSEKLRLAKQELQTDPKRAVALFTEACAMAVELNDKVAERRATRGIGAAYQRLGEYAKGIEYKKAVLELSKAVGNSIGDADAYGAIADMYAELQDFEQAGKYYDLYIAQLRTDEAED
eukprot:jgi/Mesvir1/20941/Mv08012-RA.1